MNRIAKIETFLLDIPFDDFYEGPRTKPRGWVQRDTLLVKVTSDDAVWYGDEPRGFLGRIVPTTGKVKEYALPGGAGSKPYAL